MREKHQSVFKNIEQEEQMVLSDTGILSGPTWAILEETATPSRTAIDEESGTSTLTEDNSQSDAVLTIRVHNMVTCRHHIAKIHV
ncbi:hypothetical protein VTP01DRAFT_8732 [Rhizomucor pusillus]|uniref:uncharacterized protein n=1 Tax=Rhizomucor pusillus TaxID=4840 RepID=UPI0037446919